jgi:hypothetical protein
MSDSNLTLQTIIKVCSVLLVKVLSPWMSPEWRIYSKCLWRKMAYLPPYSEDEVKKAIFQM